MDVQIIENLDYEGPDKECLLYYMFTHGIKPFHHGVG